MIGIVSHDGDVHASAVRAELHRLGAAYRMLDTSRVPMRARLSLEFPAASGSAAESNWRGRWTEDDSDGPDVADVADVGAVWWRRPQPYEVSPDLGSARDRLFAATECDAAVSGLWACLDAEWMNDPDADLAANRKPHQLKLALEEGWRIPRTCITNDAALARAFVAEERRHGRGVVFKPFSGTPETWRETRLLAEDDEARLDLVELAPVIFQEAIPGGVDIRVTIVGDRVFAAEIRPRGAAAEYDFRIEADAPIAEHVLPADVEAMLMAMMRRLGLRYGAADLRLDPSGEYVFLEINPAGQWLFIEMETGQPISQAIAELLIELDGRRAQTEAYATIPLRTASNALRAVVAIGASATIES